MLCALELKPTKASILPYVAAPFVYTSLIHCSEPVWSAVVYQLNRPDYAGLYDSISSLLPCPAYICIVSCFATPIILKSPVTRSTG